MQDEEGLVRRAQQGDQEAFAEIYEGYFDKIYRYIIVRIGNKAEAEDLTQQVFINSLRAISSFKWKGTPFSAWLFRIAHNLVVDHIRKAAKRITSPIDGIQAVSTSNPQAELERKVDIEQLLVAARQLTEPLNARPRAAAPVGAMEEGGAGLREGEGEAGHRADAAPRAGGQPDGRVE